jgi:signal transduction histidine kinase/ligand-binding sensor domain-containing protein
MIFTNQRGLHSKTTSLIKVLVKGLLLLFIQSSLTAQSSKHLGTKDGLPVQVITDITKDKQGNMWLATYDGLYRHEGARIRDLYQSGRGPDPIERAEFHTVFEDSKGIIWAGSLNGVYRINPENLEVKRILLRPENEQYSAVGGVYAIFEESEDFVWLSTDEGMYRMHKNNYSIHRIPQSSDSTGILKSVTGYKTGINENGKLWLYTDQGMIRYDIEKKTFTHRYHNPENEPIFDLPHRAGIGASTYVRKDNKGNIWFISNHSKLTKYNLKSAQLDTFSMPLPAGSWACCHTLAVDESNQIIWIGLRHGGLLQFNLNSSTFSPVRHQNRQSLISSNYIGALAFDANGKLWVGTNNGIDIIDWGNRGVRMKRISEDPEFIDLKYEMGQIHSDQDGTLYFPSFNYGLFVKSKDGSGTIRYTGLKHPDAGVSMVGQIDHNMVYVQQNEFFPFATATKSSSNISHSIQKMNAAIASSTGRPIWLFQTKANDFYLKKSNAKLYHIRNGEIKDEMNCTGFRLNLCLSQDSSILWYLGWNFELIRRSLETSKEDTILLHPLLRNIDFIFTNPRSMVDDGSCIWISSQNGLLQYNYQNKKLSYFTTADGLSSPFTFAIIADNSNRIWVASLSGIDYYDALRGRFVNAANWPLETYMDAFGSALNANDGSVIFQVGNKLIEIAPDLFPPSIPVPWTLRLDALEVNEERIPINENLWDYTLKYNQNRVTIQYSVLDFENQSRVKYVYKLGNDTRDWSFARQSGEISFKSLGPGTYIIQLGAILPNQDLIALDKKLTITIKPPFWNSWWFRTILLIIFVLSIWQLYKFRIAQLLKVEKLRNKIAADLHDDVASTVSSISYYSEFAKSQVPNESITAHLILDQIGNNAREALETMRDVIWSTKSAYDRFDAIVEKIDEYAKGLCQSNNITYRSSFSHAIDKTKLDPVTRKNIYLILKEAINNAVKHASCTVLSVHFVWKAGHWRFTIEDDGIGFEAHKSENGNGIENMSKRANDIGAKLIIKSTPGHGTYLSLEKTRS